LAIRVFPVALEGDPHFVAEFVRGKHDGIDIFASEGTPIVAVDDGNVRAAEDDKGGHVFYLTAPDRTVYYGAHLAFYEGTFPRRAVAGEVLGYVGTTGNAKGTSPHCHFEIHPSGGVAVNPFPELSLALPPPTVTSSEGAKGQVKPSPDPSLAADLPPLVVQPEIPPIPHEPRKRSRGAVVVACAGVAGLVLAALGRGARA